MMLGIGPGPMVDVSHEPARIVNIPRIAELSDDENHDIALMCEQLRRVADRNRERFVFYNAEQAFVNMGMAIPPEFEKYASVLGWNATAVDALARRIQLDGFALPGAVDRWQDLDPQFRRTGFYQQHKMCVQSMLIYGVAFMGAVKSPDGVQVQAYSARDATGLWDTARPGRLRVGLAVQQWGHFGAQSVTVFYPGQIIQLDRPTLGANWEVRRYQHLPGRVTFHPFRFLPQLDKPWGQSRITRPMMTYTRSGARTFLRGEMNGEVYGYPQLYGVNTPPDVAEQFKSGMARFFALDYERDEDGAPVEGAPESKIGQVQIGSQQPHMEQLRMTAMMFAAESQLSPDKLGVIHDNPSSADAIDRADGELNDLADEAGRDLSIPTVDLVHDLWLMDRNSTRLPEELEALATDLRDPAMTTRYSQRMALASLVNAGAVIPGEVVTYEAAGYSRTTATRLAEAYRIAERRKAQQAIAEQALAARQHPQVAPLIAARKAGDEV
ncbi:hypothetical protein [Brachybacterium sp. UMB0905]|uniref:hypothetical protein n=1 Tax=Brachybacterium sp. UMB0905 TaxID=2069310 RepID=UPI000C801C70|nr:hypothetical protein [Brachybacterium sp. UMB0905]PMC76400.1 hypothetical protein CJ197_04390 [Brachybacterium sp. UMB0905]